jgi:hypothetical protein
MRITFDKEITLEIGTPLLCYYESHADLGGMPCIFRGNALYKRANADGVVKPICVHVLEVNDGSLLYIPQHLVWFGALPNMETYEKIKQDKLENEELARIARKGQLEQLRQAVSMQRSGIVGGRMVPPQ